MSAIEVMAAPERRTAERLRPAGAIPVMFGRGSGTIVDLSSGGMRLRHSGAVTRGSQLRVAFEWQKKRFAAMAEVLASRVASLGDAAGAPTMFESRIRFTFVSELSREVLQRVLAAISSNELRRWIANLQGWNENETHGGNSAAVGSYLRCRLVGSQWKKTWTQNPAQPQHGFVVPATVSTLEIETLCDTYYHASADERHLIRLLAEEAVRAA